MTTERNADHPCAFRNATIICQRTAGVVVDHYAAIIEAVGLLADRSHIKSHNQIYLASDTKPLFTTGTQCRRDNAALDARQHIPFSISPQTNRAQDISQDIDDSERTVTTLTGNDNAEILKPWPHASHETLPSLLTLTFFFFGGGGGRGRQSLADESSSQPR